MLYSLFSENHMWISFHIFSTIFCPSSWLTHGAETLRFPAPDRLWGIRGNGKPESWKALLAVSEATKGVGNIKCYMFCYMKHVRETCTCIIWGILFYSPILTHTFMDSIFQCMKSYFFLTQKCPCCIFVVWFVENQFNQVPVKQPGHHIIQRCYWSLWTIHGSMGNLSTKYHQSKGMELHPPLEVQKFLFVELVLHLL